MLLKESMITYPSCLVLKPGALLWLPVLIPLSNPLEDQPYIAKQMHEPSIKNVSEKQKSNVMVHY